ncbi:shuttle craft like transcriptional regulator [Moniliophthora roreri MCA 2997]|uniref:Shuttle craft like transcriptional regulator n=1 Tax=Moniliophthora roreri (strain MCA 2997) TaxID=1381753 RepID=V2WKF6_MONRO|nr:shuttle craft like transcriptional regulator [Moniliophthora roreri MCA 2997]
MEVNLTSSGTNPQPSTSERKPNRRHNPNRNRGPRPSSEATSQPGAASEDAKKPRDKLPRKKPLRNKPAVGDDAGAGEGAGNTEKSAAGSLAAGDNKSTRPRPKKPEYQKPKPVDDHTDVSNDGKAPVVESVSGSIPRPPGPGRKRGIKFNAGLTNTEGEGEPSSSSNRRSRYKPKGYGVEPDLTSDDLTSNLIRGLRQPPYQDCVICCEPVRPPQPTWSCSPLTPIVAEDNAEGAHEPQYCWTTFHLKCIRSWSEKSFNDVKAAWIARGEEGRGGEWRCPGCQGRRNVLTDGYRCFCGSTPHPNNRLATPHSCGNPCSRPRTTCSHPCSLLCHPGPCPPCKVTLETVCGCVRKRVLVIKCGENRDQHGRSKGELNVSCGGKCEKPLACGKHTCQRVCHLGECSPCEESETLSCWCDKTERQGRCGEGEMWAGSLGCDERQQPSEGLGRWGFSCDTLCGKPYDCGEHFCERKCHPTSRNMARGHCPLSPDRVRTCPCGKKGFAVDSSSFTDPDKMFPPRAKCTDPIPSCGLPCQKLHLRTDGGEGLQCEHSCQVACHTGPCPPCSVVVTRPCRCGNMNKKMLCGDLQKETEILCDKACTTLRACGKHQCNRLCCPMASFGGAGKGKGKKRAGVVSDEVMDEALKALHECDLVCGKLLTCGNHACEERDHRGPCKPCLRSSFEEAICPCGRTVLEPPVPCGTQVQCPFPCARPDPPCGHPKARHACHPAGTSCPPCVVLTSKLCACGKKEVPNKPCSLVREKVGCGTVCRKLMECGFHRCDRLCHADDCGRCTSMCGKSRKLCLPVQHPCTHLCHAPAICPEDEPCQSLVALTCDCGRIKLSVHCGKSTSSPQGSSKLRNPPKCNSECSVAQRNARLADALGINVASRSGAGGGEMTYNDELVAFARANMKFLGLVESAFAEFISSPKRSQVLPHMPPERRKFVHDLAHVYRLDTQMIDQEPNRSVQIIRRIDTRVPHPLLSTHISTPSAGPTLGKLGDLRSGTTTPSSSASSWRKPTPTPAASQPKGWTSVVARPNPTLSAGSQTQPRSTPPVSNGPSRTSTPVGTSASRPTGVPAANITTTTTTNSSEDVPDNWEDDV